MVLATHNDSQAVTGIDVPRGEGHLHGEGDGLARGDSRVTHGAEGDEAALIAHLEHIQQVCHDNARGGGWLDLQLEGGSASDVLLDVVQVVAIREEQRGEGSVSVVQLEVLGRDEGAQRVGDKRNTSVDVGGVASLEGRHHLLTGLCTGSPVTRQDLPLVEEEGEGLGGELGEGVVALDVVQVVLASRSHGVEDDGGEVGHGACLGLLHVVVEPVAGSLPGQTGVRDVD